MLWVYWLNKNIAGNESNMKKQKIKKAIREDDLFIVSIDNYHSMEIIFLSLSRKGHHVYNLQIIAYQYDSVHAHNRLANDTTHA